MSSVVVKYIGIPTNRVIIELPLSKSIVARQMMIAGYYSHPLPKIGSDSCTDLKILYKALTSPGERVDVGESGTAYRFMTSYLARRPGVHLLTGARRLLERPMMPLIEALRELGADIRCINEGLLIKGKALRGGIVRIDASLSSQYISSLMLLAPTLPGGLTIGLTSAPASAPYINMTAHLLQEAGTMVTWNGNIINVAEARKPLSVSAEGERDWSAASYFLETTILTGASLIMPGLRDGLQGDSAAMKLWSKLPSEVDMHHVPDLVPAYCATLCGMDKPFRIEGVGHLKYKESDRMAVLCSELRKLGYDVEADGDSLQWCGGKHPASLRIYSHNDHRIAMALAPLAAVTGEIIIDGADTVDKSFPGYFKQLAKIGYEIVDIP